MVSYFIIGIGGFLGAVARYALSTAIQRISTLPLPLGTLTVNLLGCFEIGCLSRVFTSRPSAAPEYRLFLVIGFFGSFTTFSTFGKETLDLLNDGKYGLAVINASVSVIAGIGSVAFGWFCARSAV